VSTPARAASTVRQQSPSPGFSWSVAGVATTITLVGSIHVGFKGLYPVPDPVQRAFSESTALAMELALDREPPERVLELMIASGLVDEGKSLRSYVSEDTWNRYQGFAKEHSAQALFFDRFRPWFVAVFLSGEKAQLDGYDPGQGLDLHFFSERGNRRVIGLETATEHVNALAGLPEQTQELMLVEQLDAMNRVDDELQAVVELWKRSDADGLARQMFDEFSNPAYTPVYDALIAQRNIKMTRQIEIWLGGKERIFVVLGAGHLVGKDGIVAHLKHDGWSLVRL
jgi:uncharacterized protein YbaP (TraB family)